MSSDAYDESKAIKAVFDGPKPSLGRIVHYTPRRGAAIPAIVTAVYGTSEMVNLTIFPDGGQPVPVSSVPRATPGEANSWFWPPRT